jgi:hypothetical protein
VVDVPRGCDVVVDVARGWDVVVDEPAAGADVVVEVPRGWVEVVDVPRGCDVVVDVPSAGGSVVDVPALGRAGEATSGDVIGEIDVGEVDVAPDAGVEPMTSGVGPPVEPAGLLEFVPEPPDGHEVVDGAGTFEDDVLVDDVATAIGDIAPDAGESPPPDLATGSST